MRPLPKGTIMLQKLIRAIHIAIAKRDSQDDDLMDLANAVFDVNATK